jgi:hypothetical protein
MTKMPPKKSLSDKVALFLYRNGPSPINSIIAAIREQGHRDESIRAVVSDLRFRELLNMEDKQYSLNARMRQHYASFRTERFVGEVAGPRYYSGFKTWTGKHDPAKALRREPIREGFSVKSASIGYPVKEYA